MSPSTVGIIGILIMLVIFVTRMPVAYVMTLVGLGGFSYLISLEAGLNLLPRVFFDTFSSYELTTIPLFVLMGQLAFNSGISRRLLISFRLGTWATSRHSRGPAATSLSWPAALVP